MITPGTPVELYWNLHKHLYSVRVKGRVVAHVSGFTLKDARFSVQPAGNAKVRAEGRKNVHAFIRGEWVNDTPAVSLFLHGGVTYNPYQHTTFVARVTNQPIRRALNVMGTIRDGRANLFACGWS